MSEKTTIGWTDMTFNPWRGCTKVSEGCAHCYAETMSKRNPSTLGVWGPQGKRVVASEDYWKLPLKWNRAAEKAGERRRVFCASMADVFEDWQDVMVDSEGTVIWCCERCSHTLKTSADKRCDCKADNARGVTEYRRLTMNDLRRRLFNLICRTPNLDWLLLTKRPENINRMLGPNGINFYAVEGIVPCPQPNVWIGVSAENQERWDKRTEQLRQIPAAVRFVSAEPLLGPIDAHYMSIPGPSLDNFNWVIIGGESGAHHRPMELAWMESLAKQCKAAGVACYVKQDSARRDGQQGRIPDALWNLKQFPTVEAR